MRGHHNLDLKEVRRTLHGQHQGDWFQTSLCGIATGNNIITLSECYLITGSPKVSKAFKTGAVLV